MNPFGINYFKRKKQSFIFNSIGFSLLETMIAIGLGLFLISGLIRLFDSSRVMWRVNDVVSQFQEVGRISIDEISKSLMYRGYFGCLTPSFFEVSSGDTVLPDGVYLTSISQDYPNKNISQNSLRGYDISSAGVWLPVPIDQDIVTLSTVGISGKTPKNLSDVVSIQFASTESALLAFDMVDPGSNVLTDSTDLELQAEDNVFVGDCLQGDVFKASTVSESAGVITITHDATMNTSAQLNRNYTTESSVRKFYTFTYFVADSDRKDSADNPIYALYMTDGKDGIYEIAEGVESLQILYGYKNSDNSTTYKPASEYSSNLQIVSDVKLAVLVSSRHPMFETNAYQSLVVLNEDLAEDTSVSEKNGSYLMRVFEKNIHLRNKS